ncbi:MAG: hydroxymethylbilane synthase [Elusimicrobia bacterium]|nr:hydroxymethylbilane synthase [Elusimicrobiota bacterium]
MSDQLRLGTRGSALALAQSHQVRAHLLSRFPSLEIDVVVIKTTGDKLSESPLSAIPGKGVFIKEIEEALLEKRVDFAVHSMKDLPTDQPGGLIVGAVPPREDPRDCLISRSGQTLSGLPKGSVVGTSSLRRQAQVLAAGGQVTVQNIRGNLDTRLRKVKAGEVEAVVVAHAGVKRLGRAGEITEVLSYDVMLPAPGQGCLAIEVRDEDSKTREFISVLDHASSRRAAEAERAFLAALGGGCRVPIAAYARDVGGALVLDGLVISPDGKRKAKGRLSGDFQAAARMGEDLGEKLLKEGASDILKTSDGDNGFGA